MISAQDLIEKITSSATCDDCIVVIKEKTQANLRWAGSTLTTNGVIQERNVTVIAFVAINGAVEHASHFGWEMTARKTLDVYDWALGKNKDQEKFQILRNQ